MENQNEIKKCIFCKKIIVGDRKIPVCQSCRDKGKDVVEKAGAVVLTVGSLAVAIVKNLSDKDK